MRTRKLERLHYSTLWSNAQHNRKQAMRLFAAGFTPAEIAAEFPAVFKLTEGKLGQKYDSEMADGRKETRFMVATEAVDAMLENRKAKP